MTLTKMNLQQTVKELPTILKNIEDFVKDEMPEGMQWRHIMTSWLFQFTTKVENWAALFRLGGWQHIDGTGASSRFTKGTGTGGGHDKRYIMKMSSFQNLFASGDISDFATCPGVVVPMGSWTNAAPYRLIAGMCDVSSDSDIAGQCTKVRIMGVEVHEAWDKRVEGSLVTQFPRCQEASYMQEWQEALVKTIQKENQRILERSGARSVNGQLWGASRNTLAIDRTRSPMAAAPIWQLSGDEDVESMPVVVWAKKIVGNTTGSHTDAYNNSSEGDRSNGNNRHHRGNNGSWQPPSSGGAARGGGSSDWRQGQTNHTSSRTCAHDMNSTPAMPIPLWWAFSWQNGIWLEPPGMWNWGVHPEQNDAVAGRSSKQFEANEQRCSKSEKCISFVGTLDDISQ